VGTRRQSVPAPVTTRSARSGSAASRRAGRRPVEHTGYVIRGKVAFRSGDEEELFEAGDAYYVGPGHTPVLFAGTELVEFSPSEELGRTMQVVTKNMEEMQASSSL